MGRIATIENKTEYMREYMQKNKDKYYTDKIECEICKGKYTKMNIQRHLRTTKHTKAKNAITTSILNNPW